MNLKQLAERLGVSPRQIELELESPCKECKKAGGNNPPCEKCDLKIKVYIREG